MSANFYLLFLTALIPLAVGFVWYGPLFGKKWMAINGFTEESLKEANMVVIFALTYVFSLFLSFALSGMVIHQSGFNALFAMDPSFAESGTELNTYAQDFFAKYGELHRSFGHGALHGVMASIIVALPIIAINALFERRGWAYIWIHVGYWVISMALMGGVICAYL